MLLDYSQSAVQMLAIMAALLMCLFRSISTKRRAWLLATAMFLALLPTQYMRTAYLAVMGDAPHASGVLTHLGSNLAYALLVALVVHDKSAEERHYFHLSMILPIPLNLWQLSLYLPRGGALNSVYQVLATTLVTCLCVQSICWYLRHREHGARPPRIAVAALVFVGCEYGRWTSSCLDGVAASLYYAFSLLQSADVLAMVWAVDRTHAVDSEELDRAVTDRFQNILKSTYLIVVLACSIGGIVWGQRIRTGVEHGVAQALGSSVGEVLPAVLFAISLVPVAYGLVILFVVWYGRRVAGEGAVAGGAALAEEPPATLEPFEEVSARRLRSSVVPLTIIFGLMVLLVVYSSYAIRDVAVANVHEVGEDRIAGIAARLENYLDMTKSLLWVTADTVDYMVGSGSSSDEVREYIVEETERQVSNFDDNFTGIYGYVRGEYLDGLGWVPPEGYEPTERLWYKAAVDAQGEVVIVPPYTDAQTGDVIISICRMLSHGSGVIALDTRLDYIQGLVGELQIKEKGRGFVVDADGLVVAHADESLKGTNMNDHPGERELLEQLLAVRDGTFSIRRNGVENTVFVQEIMDQWYVVIVVGTDELLAEVWRSLMVNVIICVAIYAMIAYFYQFGRRNEQAYTRRIEEMRAEEQRQTYEARALKLEKEAADRANQAKSDFLANMSHEIRTPINAVLGMNEMILREGMDACEKPLPDARAAHGAFERIVVCAGNIESAGRNLLAIINDILDFSKIEAGRMDIVEGEYRLGSVLNDVSNMVLFRARDKGLEFVVDVDDTIPDGLFGDELRVRQVITNVLTNAVKYTERGSVRLEVRGEDVESADGVRRVLLRVAVHDTGIGIRPEDQRRMFDKFQRVDLARNSTKEGTGLGLAITKQLLALMGGSIEVQSTYGVGTTVRLEIPQEVRLDEPVGSFRERFLHTMAGAARRGGSFRAPDALVLVVDDVAMNIAVVKGLLARTEVQIHTASSGEEAILLAGQHDYDLVLMDSRMPGMGGSEAMRRIRGQGGPNATAPFVCLTADAVSGAREHYLAEGFADYLSKPIDGESLERTLVRYLPEGKVLPGGRGGEQAPVSEGAGAGVGEGLLPLRDSAVDAGIGLGYCQGDEGLYVSLLGDYLSDAPRRAEGLRDSFARRDWASYAILAHALKSSSKMIGATELSVVAARMEHAADACDERAIGEEHARMLELHAEVVDLLRLVCPDSDADAESDDDEILEFLPE